MFTKALFLSDCIPLQKVDRKYYVSKTDINPATGKAYAVNPSTGNFDDNYWANVVEPSLRGGGGGGDGGEGNPVDQLLTNVINQYTDQLNAYNKRYSDYTTNNPFVFDDVLKEETDKT